MSSHLTRSIISAMSRRPAMIAPEHNTLAADLRDLAAANPAAERAAFEARKLDMISAFGLTPVEQRKPFAFSDGKAIIPVHGLLVNRLNASWGYVTGYSFIRQQVAAAAADPEVESIVLDFHTPGGMCAGCTETGDAIRAAREIKPVLAVVDSSAYSAGYWLASAASKIAVTPSGGVGSIGVVAMHISLENALKEAGIEVTYIFAGAHKVDGNMTQNLSDEVRASIQKDVDSAYEEFVSTVAQNRGMEPDAVRATEAGSFSAREALDLGLIDSIATPSAALAAFATTEDEELEMTTPNKDGSTEQQQAAPASAEALAAARQQERERIAAITGCDEAKDKQALAAHLATKTDMSLEVAKHVLAAAAVEKLPAAEGGKANHFQNAMDNGTHPNITADGKEGGAGGEEPKPGARGRAAVAALHGPRKDARRGAPN